MSYLERTGHLTGRIEETTERQRIIAKFLSNPSFLDWYTVLTLDEIWALERQERYYNILKECRVPAQWLKFSVDKHKRLRVSTEVGPGQGGGREGLIKLARPEYNTYMGGEGGSPEQAERRRRTLREKLFGARR